MSFKNSKLKNQSTLYILKFQFEKTGFNKSDNRNLLFLMLSISRCMVFTLQIESLKYNFVLKFPVFFNSYVVSIYKIDYYFD